MNTIDFLRIYFYNYGQKLRGKIVDNWRSLWKAACLWVAGLGIVLPDLLQLIADNSESLPWFDPQWKSGMRLAALAGVIVARFIKQPSVNAPEVKP